jgi:hypothetical protein
MSENGLRKLFRINKIKILMSVTGHQNKGIVASKTNKPCEVEIIKLGLRSSTSQMHSEIHSRK